MKILPKIDVVRLWRLEFGANVLLLHAERKTLSKGMLKCSAS